MTLPWFQEDAGIGGDLRSNEADLRLKDIQRYQDHLKYNKLEKPRTNLEGVDRPRFLREGIEASDMGQTDFIPGSACLTKDKKYRERKTFMEKEKQGFSAERETRDRNWWKTESKSGIPEHPHQQTWLDAGARESASQLQTNFVMPGIRHSDRKPERGRDESGCTSDYRKYEWPDHRRASLNQERTRKPSENATSDALQVCFTRPSSNPTFRNSDALHPHNDGRALSDRKQDFFVTSEMVKDGQPLPPDWFSGLEYAMPHVRKVNQSPGGVYKGRTTYQYSQEHAPTEIVHESPTISEAILQHGNVEMKVKNSRQSLNLHKRHVNGAGNGTNLESQDGIDLETGCGFVLPQNGAKDLLLRQNSQPTTMSRFSASEAQKLGSQENGGICQEWDRTEASRKRFHHKISNDVPSGFPYSGATGTLGRYSTFPEGLSTSSAGCSVSSPLNSHYVSSHLALAARSHMPSLSPIRSGELLQSRRASRWTEGIDARKTKKLKLDLSRSIDSPLPSWMNMSTFSALSTNSIDSFKSFVDHTVQNAFMNEMKEAENYSTATANKTKLNTDAALEDYPVGHSTASRSCPSETIPTANSGILTASSMESLSSLPLSTETSGATSTSSHCSTLPVVENIPCPLEAPMSAGSDFGLLSQTSEAGVHTKFKKTWLLNYLDEDRRLSSDAYAEEYHHRSSEAAEMLSPKDKEDQFNGWGDEKKELRVNGSSCANDSMVELNDLSPLKKLDQA